MPKIYKRNAANFIPYNTAKKKKAKEKKNNFSLHGFEFWSLYFKDEDFVEVDGTVTKIEAFMEYIKSNNYNLTDIEDCRVFIVDLNRLQSNNEFVAIWGNFKDELYNKTEFCLNCMAIAMHEAIFKENIIETSQLDHDEVACPILPIIPRLSNHEPISSIKHLRGHDYGKLVSLRGTVIRTSSVQLMCQNMEFKCSCGETHVTKQLDNIFTPSNIICKCRKTSGFEPVLNSHFTETVHCQTIKLQEMVQLDSAEGGRVPRTIECELSNDLVNSCVPGDEVTVTGIIKVHSNDEGTSKTKQASLFLQYLDVNSIINNKNQVHAVGSTGGIQFTTKDYLAIQKIHAEPKLFRFLVQSLCPNIYGHEVIKAGLLLALFGGTNSDKEGYHRPDSHVLMVGDPGLGKSQMLQACTNVAPKGVYVCGNTSTNSGLTVTMCRETGGEYVLEAGALVLGDQGVCCIDEFDKMTAQHECLLEAMEQQTISIAKAGVTCRLPARTTILAAANPTGGHYNKSKTVSENLRMGSALLSRFDLVFILLDKPDEKLDSLLSEHVLAMHCGKAHSLSQSMVLDNTVQSTNASDYLSDRLKVCAVEPPLNLLSHVLFRKYIAYAKQYVYPKLSSEANQILKQFYLELRKQYQTGDSTPVTTRQLESLRRLTQARAKIELREAATEQDALEVIEVLRHSLIDVFSDESGTLDFRRSQNGSGMSSRNKVKGFIYALQKRAEKETRAIFTVKELQEVAEKIGMARGKFGTVMQTLNIQGFLLKKGPDMYQLQSVDF